MSPSRGLPCFSSTPKRTLYCYLASQSKYLTCTFTVQPIASLTFRAPVVNLARDKVKPCSIPGASVWYAVVDKRHRLFIYCLKHPFPRKATQKAHENLSRVIPMSAQRCCATTGRGPYCSTSSQYSTYYWPRQMPVHWTPTRRCFAAAIIAPPVFVRRLRREGRPTRDTALLDWGSLYARSKTCLDFRGVPR